MRMKVINVPRAFGQYIVATNLNFSNLTHEARNTHALNYFQWWWLLCSLFCKPLLSQVDLLQAEWWLWMETYGATFDYKSQPLLEAACTGPLTYNITSTGWVLQSRFILFSSLFTCRILEIRTVFSRVKNLQLFGSEIRGDEVRSQEGGWSVCIALQ